MQTFPQVRPSDLQIQQLKVILAYKQDISFPFGKKICGKKQATDNLYNVTE